ncbi:hypothetical protein [Mycobacterium ulcerans]|uniref:hypothetical protein n=1 Tax=Mycobacterium ulcerans TaxID=1809 RepID=UPI00223919AA|nr:hypothetical protein [Mycobacterium ulcerans]
MAPAEPAELDPHRRDRPAAAWLVGAGGAGGVGGFGDLIGGAGGSDGTGSALSATAVPAVAALPRCVASAGTAMAARPG